MIFLRFQVGDENIHIPFSISTFWKLQENHGQISINSVITNWCWWCSINIIFPFYSIMSIAVLYYYFDTKCVVLVPILFWINSNRHNWVKRENDINRASLTPISDNTFNWYLSMVFLQFSKSGNRKWYMNIFNSHLKLQEYHGLILINSSITNCS